MANVNFVGTVSAELPVNIFFDGNAMCKIYNYFRKTLSEIMQIRIKSERLYRIQLSDCDWHHEKIWYDTAMVAWPVPVDTAFYAGLRQAADQVHELCLCH